MMKKDGTECINYNNIIVVSAFELLLCIYP